MLHGSHTLFNLLYSFFRVIKCHMKKAGRVIIFYTLIQKKSKFCPSEQCLIVTCTSLFNRK
jgi:uncharacterized protein YfkK (UPF0435 family)